MKKIDLGYNKGGRRWVKDHWEYDEGCTPLERCLEITNDFDKALKMLSQWTDENGGPTFTICTNNHWEAELEQRRIEHLDNLYAAKHEKVLVKQ